jgi:hypothetical protein
MGFKVDLIKTVTFVVFKRLNEISKKRKKLPFDLIKTLCLPYAGS